MLKKQILILCMICCTHLSSCQLFDILQLGKTLTKLKGAVDGALETKDNYNSVVGIFLGGEEDKIQKQIEEISTKIDDIQKSMKKHFTMVEKFVVDMPGIISQSSLKQLYRVNVEAISHSHDLFLGNIHKKIKNPKTWEEFAHKEGTTAGTNIVHLSSVLNSDPKSGSKGLIEIIGDIGQGSKNTMCKEHQTVAYNLIQLLKSVILSEMKALHLLTASFKLRHSQNNDWRSEVELHVEFFEKRYLTYLTTFLNALKKSPRFLRACDPPRWIRDENYFQFRGYQSWFPTEKRTSCSTNQYSPLRQLCKVGSSLDKCYAGDKITTCQVGARHLWVQINDKKYGEKSISCETVNGHSHVYDATGMLGWGEDVCFCSCKEVSWLRESYVSLRESLADVDKNMVITGAKIVLRTTKLQRVLYIQVKAGILLANGEIDPDSNDWVDLPTGIQSKETLSIYPGRFTLNNPVLPVGYVAVGVRFVEADSYVGLYIEVIGKKFDLDTGKLLPGALQYAGKSDELWEYKPVKITSRSSVYGENLNHVRNSGKYKVDLQIPDLYEDIPYLPVPLFDGVPVVTEPPTPLGGIGLYHKHADGFAGFIAVQLNSLPYKDLVMGMLRNYKPDAVLDECNENSCTPDNIFDLGEKLHAFMQEVIEADKDFLQNNPYMKDKFNEITEKLTAAESKLEIEDFNALITNATTISQPANSPSLEMKRSLKKMVQEIDQQYADMHSYVQTSNGFNCSPVATANDAIHYLETFFILPPRTSFIEAISNHYQNTSQNECQSDQTMQHILTQIFQKIMVTEMKATLGLLVYHKLKSAQKASEKDISEIRGNFEKRFIKYVNAFSTTMHKVPGDIRACDAKRAAIAQDKRYFKVEEVQREVVFHHKESKHNNKICDREVKNGTAELAQRHECDKNLATECYAAKRIAICRGANPWIIPLEPGQEKSVYRDCTKKIQYPKSRKEMKQCVCNCGKQKNFISLALVMANVTDNMVVTGVRFLNKNGIFHIQLKQGKLSSNGWIKPDPQNGWIPVEENPKRVMTISAARNKFFLDDIIFPSSYAVVGLQFIANDGFFLRVIAQKFNFPTGMLLEQNRTLVAQHDLYQKLQFESKNSIGANVPHHPSPQDHWIELTTSGGTVLPLFDALAVEADPPTVIGGIGIFHNGAPGYAGYIALRLHSLQFQKNLEYFLVRHRRGHAFVSP